MRHVDISKPAQHPSGYELGRVENLFNPQAEKLSVVSKREWCTKEGMPELRKTASLCWAQHWPKYTLFVVYRFSLSIVTGGVMIVSFH